MLVTFANTPIYLKPEDDTLTAIPEGYKMSIQLPPQEKSDEVTTAAEASDNALLALISTNAWLTFIFGVSM